MKTEQNDILPLTRALPSRGRLRFFFLFVLLSFVLWVSTKLSKSYTVVDTFEIEWLDAPKSIFLNENMSSIDLTLQASGIEILWYRLFRKPLEISLATASEQNEHSIQVNLTAQRYSLENQLFDNTQIQQISPSITSLSYSKLGAKKVPILATTAIEFRPGYLSVSSIQLEPEAIEVYGPISILDTLSALTTMPFEVKDVHESIQTTLSLEPISELKFEKEQVTAFLAIDQFTEQVYEVGIELRNLPKGKKLRLFPPRVSVKATFPLSELKRIKASDFVLVVDYNDIVEDSKEELEIKLEVQPNFIKQLFWTPKTVNYLLRE